MENSSTATTVEIDNDGFEDLKSQIINGKNTTEKPVEKETPKNTFNNKKYVLRKGDQIVELEDDYELEMTADKKPVKLTLKELKDRAAGDIAVKNRMHALAEEKKKISSTFLQFAKIAKTDPLAALEFISSKANEADSEFEYNSYIEKLAEQAENLGKMDPKDREAMQREKRLKQAEENLSQRERQQNVSNMRQELISNYPEIGDSEFSNMVEALLDNEEIMSDLTDEYDFMDKMEELIQETLTQRDLISVISEINPSYINDNKLIFSLSDQIRLNPDLNEKDIREIVADIIPPSTKQPPRQSAREKDVRTLSNKQRQSMGSQYREQASTDFDVLKQQLMDRREEIRKTPLAMR